VKKFENRPFAIVGVNVDTERTKAKQYLSQKKISWPSFWDNEDGPINRQWNVRGYPTAYLIDHNGIILGQFLFDDKGVVLLGPGAGRKAADVIAEQIQKAEKAGK